MTHLADPKETWTQRFATPDYIFGESPNAYLASQQANLKPGKALAIADGEGRNGVWLAQQGLAVDSFDFVESAVEKAKNLAQSRQVRLNAQCSAWQHFDWQEAAYDNVVGIFFQFAAPTERAELFQKIDCALKPGGVLILQGYSPEQLNYNTGGPGILEHLYTEDLMREAFGHYEILDCRTYTDVIHEGRAHSGKSGLLGFTAIKSMATLPA
jgi:cyclopropane fatty-acyl-phospholipid synthase-like methyltransferase